MDTWCLLSPVDSGFLLPGPIIQFLLPAHISGPVLPTVVPCFLSLGSEKIRKLRGISSFSKAVCHKTFLCLVLKKPESLRQKEAQKQLKQVKNTLQGTLEQCVRKFLHTVAQESLQIL